MAEPTKQQQVGEGSDNFGNAARQIAQAAKQAGKTVAKQAVAKGTEAAASAAASTVKAGVATGKAVSEIAAGTAAGGPWGAIIAAAWSLRHTLFKILVCVCMFVLILVIIIVSLPCILFENVFGWMVPEQNYNQSTLYRSYDDLSLAINEKINTASESVLGSIMDSLTGSAFDLVLSLANIVDKRPKEQQYDVCYILASYSVAMGQSGTSKTHLLERIDSVSDKMFPVTYETRQTTREVLSAGEWIVETVNYLVCTISPFDESVLWDAFGLDMDKYYGNSTITNREYVAYMTKALKLTLGDRA